MFDPRPPWWKPALLLLALLVIVTLPPARFSSHSRFSSGQSLRKFELRTPDLMFDKQASVIFEHISTSTLYRDTVTVKMPEVVFNGTRLDDPIGFLQSDLDQAAWIRNELSGMSLGRNIPDWHARCIEGIYQGDYHGTTSITYWGPLGIRYTKLVLIPIIIILFVGWLWVKSIVTSRREKMQTGLCPSCDYEVDHEEFATCPECGLNLKREIKLLVLLHTDGYLGLKRLQKLDAEGAWKN